MTDDALRESVRDAIKAADGGLLKGRYLDAVTDAAINAYLLGRRAVSIDAQLIDETKRLDTEIARLKAELADVRQTARRKALEDAAQVAEATYPRGSAHTYASENADRYVAMEDAAEFIAGRIRALLKEPQS